MMNNTNQLTAEAVEEAVRAADWEEIYYLYWTLDYGMKIQIFSDSSVATQDSSTYYRDPAAEGLVYQITTSGGNLDSTELTEGFAHYDGDTDNYIETETGRVIGGFNALVEEVAKDGEYSDWIDEHVSAAGEQHDQYITEQRLRG